jgi:tetratricopeptide (TPR) repeat protein
LDAAKWLLGTGCPVSAARLLDASDSRGRVANELRESASEARGLGATVYGVLVIEGRAYVVPVVLRERPTTTRSPEHRAALSAARGWVSHWFDWKVPEFSLTLEDFFEPDGSSLGVAAVLAAIEYYAGRAPHAPVVVSGSVAADGSVGEVSDVATKVLAAEAERASGQRFVLVAAPGARNERIEEVVQEAFRFEGRPTASSVVARLARQLTTAILQPDHEEAASRLEELLRNPLPPKDAARARIELGNRYRHLGRTAEAAQCLAVAGRDLAAGVVRLEQDRIVELEIIGSSTLCDQYELERAERQLLELRARYPSHLMSTWNEIQLNGTLAQAISMQGRPHEAVRERSKSIPLCHESSELLAELPRTLATLALDLARAGEEPRFRERIDELFSSPQSETQRRFSFAYLLRGLVLLGRFDEALRVLSDGSYRSEPVPVSLQGLNPGLTGQITQHPEVSVARAIARALRRVGSPRDAVQLAERVIGTQGLIRWLALLAQGEKALALRELGDEAGASSALEKFRHELVLAAERPSNYHRTLFSCDWSGLEAALDESWY